jgi:hypothetical protein
MSSARFEKGDFVLATEDGRGPLWQGYGTITFKAGEELIVTSDRSRLTVNVKRSGGSRVFQIPREKLRVASRKVGEVPEDGIAPDDPRIAWLFDDAAKLAERMGLCHDYDRITDALGIPGRTRTFTIEIELQGGLKISAKVEARSRKLAEQTLREQLLGPMQVMKAIAA